MKSAASNGRILVVGAGIAGLSTAWALTRQGYAVEIFDQGPIPNPRSSSHDEHRITRHAYGTQEGYAYMMPQAFRAYEAMWRDIGANHHLPTSACYLVRGEQPWYDGVRLTLSTMDVGFRELDTAAIHARLPMVRLDEDTRVVETDKAGILYPIRILTDLVVRLAKDGAIFHADTKVSAIDPEKGTLTADGKTHAGDAIVICAGAWVSRLVPSLARTVTPSRQCILYLAPPRDLAEAWSQAPVIADVGPQITYCLPPRGNARLKIGDHHFSRQGDPDGDRIARQDEIDAVIACGRQTFKDFDSYTILERKICFYTVTDDEHFVVEPLGAKGWVSSPCSGHGFKLGALIGAGLASAIAGHVTSTELSAWAAGRLPYDTSSALFERMRIA
ncbi:sarcosine oxidase/sarcosine oxidase subunit beta [Arboricoccus pini]|uniref:Sarcosine oxidase/sarcosine oxidase subunit beta n=1 Tax=Arboricoccus pini TaxID=1963835 RepID=A0A212QMH1_9PROT|nr:FAD-dependent oxidoreductase [Arboricoccus pini]SNB60593.1 sarcosine oxidase/sarcosine oxidase subunit beta [Arboricoccus pini]